MKENKQHFLQVILKLSKPIVKITDANTKDKNKILNLTFLPYMIYKLNFRV